MKRAIVIGIGITLLLSGSTVEAAATLGIALDSFLGTFQAWVIGLGLLVALVGLLGYVGSLFDNPFSNILAGSVNWVVKAGLLAGGPAVLVALGFVGGAVLP